VRSGYWAGKRSQRRRGSKPSIKANRYPNI